MRPKRGTPRRKKIRLLANVFCFLGSPLASLAVVFFFLFFQFFSSEGSLSTPSSD